MGTNIQEVYDSFFIKIPSVSFIGKESLVFQLFKSSLPYCEKTVPEDLTYIFDQTLWIGNFNNTISQATIELIALCMKREHYRRELDKYTSMKQYIGTQAFNKLPDIPKQSQEARMNFELLENDIEKFKQDFNPYLN